MTPNEYQKEALRTASGMSQEYPRILNGLMGLNGEAGECIDILKKQMLHGIWRLVRTLSGMIWKRSFR